MSTTTTNPNDALQVSGSIAGAKYFNIFYQAKSGQYVRIAGVPFGDIHAKLIPVSGGQYVYLYYYKKDNRYSTAGRVPISTPVPVRSELTIAITPTETRTIVPCRLLLPSGKWSDVQRFNFDTGASWATDVPLKFLDEFGFGEDGVPTDERKERPCKIRIEGLDGEYDIPVVVQDKEHYDLFREQPEPVRYPAMRLRDLTTKISMVFSATKTVFRHRNVPIPELDSPNLIKLPDMAPREGTPTRAWQWMKVNFVNPASNVSMVDWFGLNTGDRRIILKKESLGDKIKLPLLTDDSCNFDSRCTMDFIEAEKPVKLENVAVSVRFESCRFARGSDARNIGGGVEFLKRYTMIIYDMHRVLVPVVA